MKYTFLTIALLSIIYSFTDFNVKETTFVYLGSTEIEYIFENNEQVNPEGIIAHQENKYPNYASQLIKIDPFEPVYNSNKFFTEKLLEAIQTGGLTALALDDSTQRISYEEIASTHYRIDTIVRFDDETYEEEIRYVQSSPVLLINSYKIKQKWFYNKQKKALLNEVVQIIPIAWKKNKKGEVIKKEICRIKNNRVKARTQDVVNNKDNIWVKKTENRLEFEYLQIKNEQFKKALDNILIDLPKAGKTIVYKSNDKSNHFEELSSPQFQKIISEIKDTSIIFIEASMEEHIRIKTKAINQYDDFDGLRFSQLWHFDSKSKSLNSRLISIEPFILKRDWYSKEYYPIELYLIRF